MSDEVVPYLMFEGRAEEAMRFYVSVFPESRVIEIARYGKGAPGAEGSRSGGCLRLARGRESTILTSPLGTPGPGSTGGKTLLGQ